ncbi:MAG: WYL domain-containing protein [Myxococcota bacterium]
MSVFDRLGRLLFIVPYVASRGGVPTRELAEVVGAKPSQIESDIELLAMVGQPPLTPDHLIDLYIEDDVVYVELDQSLTRPLRLTHEEARALVLGAKLVGDLGGLGSELERVLERITEVLNPVDRAAVRSLSEQIAMDDEGGVADHGALLRRAIAENRRITVEYYSQSSDALKAYILEPVALLTHAGFEYVLALDVSQARHEKLFRLDRLGSVELQNDVFEPPQDLDLERYRRPRLYFGDGAYSARIRFDAAIAHKATERHPPQDVVQLPDRRVEVKVKTSSSAWLARWALQYGIEAEVLEPPEVRDYFRELCERALDAYED